MFASLLRASLAATRGLVGVVTSSLLVVGCFGGNPGGGNAPPLMGADGSVAIADGGAPRTDGGATGGDGGMTSTRTYSEPLCNDTADLSDLASGYTVGALRSTAEAIAMRRYPIGLVFIEEQGDEYLPGWFQDTTTFGGVLDGFETAVHEGAHIWDFSNSPGGQHLYRVRDDLTITTAALDNYARSEILALHVDRDSDIYDEVYLEDFSGTQGFNNLLDEYNAYVHSLAARYCTRDSLGSTRRISARDGILTMMYYVELYLKVARTNHPDDYAEIIGDPGHLEMILTVWDRAEFWLDITEGMTELGIRDETIRGWVYQADNLLEIEMLRDLAGS